jgi:hypothetical protein
MSKNITKPAKVNEPESFMDMVNQFSIIQKHIVSKYGDQNLTPGVAKEIEKEINSALGVLFQAKIIKKKIKDLDPKVTADIVMGGPEKPSLQINANLDLKKVMDLLGQESKKESEAFGKRVMESVNKQIDNGDFALAPVGEVKNIVTPEPNPNTESVPSIPNNIGKFIDGSSCLLTVTGRVRYGGGYIAFIAGEDSAGDLQSYLTSGDCDWIALDGGVLGADWYPVGWGDTPLQAMTALNKKCGEIITEIGDEDDFREIIDVLELLNMGTRWIDNAIFGQPLKGEQFTLRTFEDLKFGKVHDLLWKLPDGAPVQEKEYPPFSGAAIDVFHALATRGAIDVGDLPSKAGFAELIGVDLAQYFNHGEKAGLTKDGYVLLGKFFVAQSIVENQFKDFWKKLCDAYAK